MSGLIGNERRTLAFAAGAGRSRDGNERQHGPGGLADSLVVAHFTALGEQEIHTLGRIDGAAAAEAHEEIHRSSAGHFEAASDIEGGGIFADRIEDAHFEAGRPQQRLSTCRMPGPNDARIGDQQDPVPAQTGGQFAETIQATGPEHHAGPKSAVEGGKRHALCKTRAAGDIFKPSIQELD